MVEEPEKLGYYTIKHTDGNVMPILKQIADCKPDAIHSLDPQGGINLREVRKIVGNKIALIGNVNCGLLQTGTKEECDADVIRSLTEGMADGKGYIFLPQIVFTQGLHWNGTRECGRQNHVRFYIGVGTGGWIT